MESLMEQSTTEQPKSYKAVVYLRVNHSDNLDDRGQTKSQASKVDLCCRVTSQPPNDVEKMQKQLDKLRDFAKQKGHNICAVDTDIVRGLDRIARNYFIWRMEHTAKA